MRRRLRKRRVVKWLATGLVGVFAVCWVVGSQFDIWYINSQLGPMMVISEGGLGVGFSRSWAVPVSGFFVERSSGPGGWFWPFVDVENASRSIYVGLPFWLLIGIGSVFAAIAWRIDRLPAGFCKTCEYDLTGNTSGVCPECGERI